MVTHQKINWVNVISIIVGVCGIFGFLYPIAKAQILTNYKVNEADNDFGVKTVYAKEVDMQTKFDVIDKRLDMLSTRIDSNFDKVNDKLDKMKETMWRIAGRNYNLAPEAK
jgi:hypothetical protein